MFLKLLVADGVVSFCAVIAGIIAALSWIEFDNSALAIVTTAASDIESIFGDALKVALVPAGSPDIKANLTRPDSSGSPQAFTRRFKSAR